MNTIQTRGRKSPRKKHTRSKSHDRLREPLKDERKDRYNWPQKPINLLGRYRFPALVPSPLWRRQSYYLSHHWIHGISRDGDLAGVDSGGGGARRRVGRAHSVSRGSGAHRTECWNMVTFRCAYRCLYRELSLSLRFHEERIRFLPPPPPSPASKRRQNESEGNSVVGGILHLDGRIASASIRDHGRMYSSSHRETARVERPRFISHCSPA